MKRFEIWLANLPVIENSHVQRGTRPVIIVSNDVTNTLGNIVTVVPLTTQAKKPLRTHIALYDEGLSHVSLALCEQILTLDKTFLIKRIGFVHDVFDQTAINHALRVQLGMAA